MINGKLLPLLFIVFASAMISSCGGGGGGGGTPPQASSSSSTLSSSSQSMSSAPAVPLQPLDRYNTPEVVSSYLDLVSFAKSTAATLLNDQYASDLPDGVYRDSCEGGKGLFELRVSGNGNRLVQKYTDCLLTLENENGVAEKTLLNGEESISKQNNQYGPSRITLSWKNYSLQSNADPAVMLNGTFVYEGLLYFDRFFIYEDVTSNIEVNAIFQYGDEVVDVGNASFVFSFPALFDRSDSGDGWFDFEPKGLHIFSSQISSAIGTLTVGGVKSNFTMEPSAQRVVFSNAFSARSYLETTSQGFYIKWDENGDGLAEANIFLTENEYSDLSENLAGSEDIYFTRYPNGYVTLPPNHSIEGRYAPVELSRGSSTEINVQEFFTSKSGALLTYEINGQAVSPDWEQLEAGRFKLLFPHSDGTETYQLEVTAVDGNNRSPVLLVIVRMNDNLADTDNDGILDIEDPDIDNDGVLNDEDRFPKDPSEWSDFDYDGIGDNTDPDLDNDGIENEEDYFPYDVNCSKEGEGDDYGCYLTRAKYAFNDGNSIVYFLQTILAADGAEKSRIVRFDVESKQFLPPSEILNVSGGYSYVSLYSQSHNRFLLRVTDEKKLYLVDADDFSMEEVRSTAEEYFYPQFSEGDYYAVYVSSNQTSHSWTEVYDWNGQLVDSNKAESIANPTHYLSQSVQKSETVPFCKYSIFLDENGALTKAGDFSQVFDDNCSGVNSTSPSHLYTFPERTYFGPRAVYDRDGTAVVTVNDHQMQWMGDKLVYLDADSYPARAHYDLVVNDFIADEIKRYSPVDFGIGEIYVLGENIVVFTPEQYGVSSRLMIFDSMLNVEFDSKAVGGI